MHNDDRPVGRLMSRRQVVALFGASAAAVAGALATGAQAQSAGGSPTTRSQTTFAPNCIAIPQQAEGPYFVDEKLLRSDLRQDPSNGTASRGAPLELRLNITSLGAGNVCTPMPGALVDLWQCDAMGVYSDAQDRSFDTRGRKFLRGYQVTDASGAVRFTTIYPGWYPGRAVHIHVKVRTPQVDGQGSEFTSQFYFDERLTDRVHAREPYVQHRGQRLLNQRDFLFGDSGAQLILPVTEAGQDYAAVFNVAIAPNSRPGRGRGPGRGGRG